MDIGVGTPHRISELLTYGNQLACTSLNLLILHRGLVICEPGEHYRRCVAYRSKEAWNLRHERFVQGFGRFTYQR